MSFTKVAFLILILAFSTVYSAVSILKRVKDSLRLNCEILKKFMRKYINQNLEQCTKDSKVNFNFEFPDKNLPDVITIAGNFTVLEKIHGPLDVSIESIRCTLDMNRCEKLQNRNVKQICSKLTTSGSFISKVIQNIEPPLNCPVKIGNYTINTTDVDLKFLSFMPMDGFIFNLIIKFISTNPSTKSRIVASCIRVEEKVEKVRVSG
jgi:hypothetical protein